MRDGFVDLRTKAEINGDKSALPTPEEVLWEFRVQVPYRIVAGWGVRGGSGTVVRVRVVVVSVGEGR